MLVTPSYFMSSEITLHRHNANSQAKLVSYKTCLMGFLLYLDTSLSWATNVQDEKVLESNSIFMIWWQEKFSEVFESGVVLGKFLQKLKVKSTDVEWCIFFVIFI